MKDKKKIEMKDDKKIKTGRRQKKLKMEDDKIQNGRRQKKLK